MEVVVDEGTAVEVGAPDGWRLGARLLAARGPRRGTAVLLHAMMADARSLDRPAGLGLGSLLADAGWDVLLADFRGHGRSGPLPSEGGSWDYQDLVRLDVPAFVETARARGGPVVVVGHSLGGHVTAASLGTGHTAVDALVCLGGNVWMPRLEPSRRRALLKSVNMVAFRAVARPRYAPVRRLRFGPADESRPYVRDLTRFWFDDRWGERGGDDYYGALPSVTCPVLSIVGRGDRLLCHIDSARHWAAPLRDCELWHVGRATGLSYDPGHMDLGSNPRSRPMWRDLADWLATRVGC